MPKRPSTGRSRLLATISGPPRVKVYRAAFRPFESTRYLDVRALARVREATVELGTVEVPGRSVAIAAVIRKGMITELRPVACWNCSRPRKRPAASLRSVLRDVTRRVEATREPYLRLPMPLTVSRRAGASIKIGPIVIIIDEDAPCIWIWVGSRYCLICTFGGICG